MTGENPRRAVQKLAQKAHRLQWQRVLVHARTAAWTCLIICPTQGPGPLTPKPLANSQNKGNGISKQVSAWPYSIASRAVLSTEMTVALLGVLALSGIPFWGCSVCRSCPALAATIQHKMSCLEASFPSRQGSCSLLNTMHGRTCDAVGTIRHRPSASLPYSARMHACITIWRCCTSV